MCTHIIAMLGLCSAFLLIHWVAVLVLNWPEHVGAKHRGIYTVCPDAGNLPCGSQARGSVDGSSWETERVKLGDKSWWADGEGNGGE